MHCKENWRLVYRVPFLLVQLAINLPLTLLSFVPPFPALKLRGLSINERMQRWWAAGVCRVFGVQRRISGAIHPGPALVAANHISWIDIQVLHSASSMGFVAKAEVERWPLAGWLARVGNTVFHHRGSHDSARDVAAVMASRLDSGQKVAIFAEGGVLPGHGIKRFHARLFAPAIDSAVPVQPVMLRYFRDGKPYPDITFLPGEHFLGNFFRLLGQRPCTVDVAILPVIEAAGKQRRDLAVEAQSAVEAAFHAPAPQ